MRIKTKKKNLPEVREKLFHYLLGRSAWAGKYAEGRFASLGYGPGLMAYETFIHDLAFGVVEIPDY